MAVLPSNLTPSTLLHVPVHSLLKVHAFRIDDLDILWIDEDGNEKHYTKISPGRSHTQHTYVGHRWMVRAALCGKAPRNGQALLSFVGRSGIQRLKIPDPDHSGTASSALVSGAVEDFMGGGEMGHSSDQRGEMLSEDGVEEHAAEGSGLVSVFRFSNDMEKALSVTWETRTGEKMGEDAARGLLVRPGETLEATAPADAFAVVCTEAGDYVCTCAGAAPSAAHHRISYDPALLESGSRQPVPNVHNYESVTVQGFQVRHKSPHCPPLPALRREIRGRPPSLSTQGSGDMKQQ